jgi:high-affinity nickel-transport protein
LWTYANNFNINSAGFVIVGLFAATWILALAIWRFGRIESRWSDGMRSRPTALAQDEPPTVAS